MRFSGIGYNFEAPETDLEGPSSLFIKLDPKSLENSTKTIVTVANEQEQQTAKSSQHTQPQPDNFHR